jgi:hypothetical protein
LSYLVAMYDELGGGPFFICNARSLGNEPAYTNSTPTTAMMAPQKRNHGQSSEKIFRMKFLLHTSIFRCCVKRDGFMQKRLRHLVIVCIAAPMADFTDSSYKGRAVQSAGPEMFRQQRTTPHAAPRPEW